MERGLVRFADGHTEELVFYRVYHKEGDDMLIEFYTACGKYIYQNFMGDDGIRKYVFGVYKKEMDDNGSIRETLVPCDIVSVVIGMEV